MERRRSMPSTQEVNISIIHDVVNTFGQIIMNFASNLEVLKTHCDNLDALVVDMPELEHIQNKLNDVERSMKSISIPGTNFSTHGIQTRILYE